MASALVGGAFLSASVQTFVEKIASREFRDLLKNKKLNISLLDELKTTLLTLQAVLIDAEEKQITNHAVKDWLDLMKDAVLEAEDLLDEINTEALGYKVEAEYPHHTIARQVWNSLSSSFQFHLKMNSNLEAMCGRLQIIARQIGNLGLQVVTSKISHGEPTSSLVDESNMVGRHDDKEKLMDLLLSDDANNSSLGVITICGMGGVGKTTLAQLLYNDCRVEQHFDLKAWAWVAESDVTRVTKTLIESATSKSNKSDNLNVLQIGLKQILKEKKFLIVFDDLWNDNYNEWVKLLTPFNSGKSGSRIIITTRQKDVAQMAHTFPVHYLEPLSHEDCWSLLAQHAFVNDNPSRHPNLEIIGKKIAKKCGGLPIAAKVLGGLLRLEVDENEWIKVLKSNTWDIPKNDVLPALWLSYLYLSPYLKRCFAYCSIFPKGYILDKEFIILLWMAEGFVQESQNEKLMEEIGSDYFDELLSRSLIQHDKKDNFIMHDLVNDLATVVSGKTCSRFESCTTPNYVRHLSYFRHRYESFNRFRVCSSTKCLRTFLPLPFKPYEIDFYEIPEDYDYLSRQVPLDLVPKLRCLRVLSLRHYNIKELPNSIGNLIHLRLLDLCFTPIKRLPNAICKLYNLQTLLLYMCLFLIELPSDIGKLVNLRHLDIWSIRMGGMPRQLARLKTLRTLGSFYVGKKKVGLSLGSLRNFPKLKGKLMIHDLKNVDDASDAFHANLINKEQIDELHLSWDESEAKNCPIANDVLEQLQPSTNLKTLDISFTGGLSRFPSWLGHPSYSKLVYLIIGHCYSCSSLPAIGKLPSLKFLIITSMHIVKTVSAEFYGSSEGPSCSLEPFAVLEKLEFKDMPEWEEWEPFAGATAAFAVPFPRLKCLTLIECPKLKGYWPHHLPSLTELDIKECDQLESTPSVTLVPWMTSIQSLTIEKDTHTGQGLLSMILSVSTSSNCLQHLILENIPHLTSFPTHALPTSLQSLKISACPNLRSIFISDQASASAWNLSHLTLIKIENCPNFESFPQGGLPTPNLFELSINNCEKLESLPEWMNALTNLQRLSILNLPNLASFPQGGLAPNLTRFEFINCEKLPPMAIAEMGFQRLTSLVYLYTACDNLIDTLLKDRLLPTSLETLVIWNLANLEFLQGQGLHHLTSLNYLSVNDCPRLTSLPEDSLPSSLQVLKIHECPFLEARYHSHRRKHWCKIAHIPTIVINEKVMT